MATPTTVRALSLAVAKISTSARWNHQFQTDPVPGEAKKIVAVVKWNRRQIYNRYARFPTDGDSHRFEGVYFEHMLEGAGPHNRI